MCIISFILNSTACFPDTHPVESTIITSAPSSFAFLTPDTVPHILSRMQFMGDVLPTKKIQHSGTSCRNRTLLLRIPTPTQHGGPMSLCPMSASTTATLKPLMKKAFASFVVMCVLPTSTAPSMNMMCCAGICFARSSAYAAALQAFSHPVSPPVNAAGIMIY